MVHGCRFSAQTWLREAPWLDYGPQPAGGKDRLGTHSAKGRQGLPEKGPLEPGGQAEGTGLGLGRRERLRPGRSSGTQSPAHRTQRRACSGSSGRGPCQAGGADLPLAEVPGSSCPAGGTAPATDYPLTPPEDPTGSQRNDPSCRVPKWERLPLTSFHCH